MTNQHRRRPWLLTLVLIIGPLLMTAGLVWAIAAGISKPAASSTQRPRSDGAK